jgi:hypothetical protein
VRFRYLEVNGDFRSFPGLPFRRGLEQGSLLGVDLVVRFVRIEVRCCVSFFDVRLEVILPNNLCTPRNRTISRGISAWVSRRGLRSINEPQARGVRATRMLEIYLVSPIPTFTLF